MTLTIRAIWFTLLFQIFFKPVFSQTVIYVDANAQGSNNGTSWANAYTNLDSAFSKGKSLTYTDTIKVAEGTYKPSLKPKGSLSTDPRDVCFIFPLYVNIKGGYQSGTDNRDPRIYPSILSGDLGVQGDTSDNSYHIILSINNIAYSIVDGFTIEYGNANGSGELLVDSVYIPRSEGSGIYLYNSNFSFDHLEVLHNVALNGAGGIKFKRSNNIINNSFFIDNISHMDGGAIVCDSSALFIGNGVFYGNSSFQFGGAILHTGGIGELDLGSTTFAANTAMIGGALSIGGNDSNYMHSCVFSNNIAYYDTSGTSYFYQDIFDTSGKVSIGASLLQSDYLGDQTCKYGPAYFKNIKNISGKDGILGTSDDGLNLTPSSPGFKTGDFTGFDYDIAQAPRSGSKMDMGAYENIDYLSIHNHTIYVDSAAKGNNTGLDWPNALNELDGALKLSNFGLADTIKVAKGNYFPKNNETQDGSLNHLSFVIPENTVLLGGYSSGGGLRDPFLNRSVMNGAIPNAGYHVMMITEKHNVIIDGMVISNGDANSTLSITILGKSYSDGDGGGVFIDNSKVILKNCTFENNKAIYNGGGLRALNSTLTIENCRANGNQIYNNLNGSGAGIYIKGGYFTKEPSSISKSIFQNNTSSYNGAGLTLDSVGTISIDSCSFLRNKSAFNGGGLYANGTTSITMNYGIFDSNEASSGAGMINLTVPTGIFYRSFFIHNLAAIDGGGVYNTSGDFGDCQFIFNTAGRNGGGISSGGYTGLFFSDLAANKAAYGGGMHNGNNSPVYNSIFWKNTINGSDTSANADINAIGMGLHNSFQVYKDTYPGNDNATGDDPQFTDINNPKGADGIFGTNDDGLVLQVGSPMINRGGKYLTPSWLTTDITGGPRIVCKSPDIGAYERNDCNSFTFPNHTLYVDSSAVNGSRYGVNWANAFTNLDSALHVVDSFSIDTIKIAKGTYAPMAEGFTLPSKIVVQGGYPSGGGTRDIPHNEVRFWKYFLNIQGSSTAGMITIKDNSDVELDGIVITSLTAPGYPYGGPHPYWKGSAILASNSKVRLKNITVRDLNINFGTANFTNCQGSVTNSIFTNDTSLGPSCIYLTNSPLQFTNCVFNKFKGQLAPTTFEINRSGGVSFTNCTFYKNYKSSGVIMDCDTIPFISNCIFWGNTNNYGYDDTTAEIKTSYFGFISSRVKNTIFEFNNYKGTINSIVGKYPDFLDSANIFGADKVLGTADDGLALSGTSIAIDKGDNNLIPSGITTDITGRPRINQGIVDLGAYENDSVNHNICQVDTPDFNIKIDSSQFDLVHFTDLTPENYTLYQDSIKWYFGDGDSSSAHNPSHVYQSPGTYSIRMIYTGFGGCMKDTVKPVTISQKPCIISSLFAINGDSIAPATIHFTNLSKSDSLLSFIWYFGTGDSSLQKDPTYIYANPGTYKIELRAIKNLNCQAFHDTTIIIKAASANCSVKADFSWSGTTKAPAIIHFTNLSSGSSSYNWNFGDGKTSNDKDPDHLYINPGSYSITLIDSSGPNCYDTTRKLIVIDHATDTCVLKPGFIFYQDSSSDKVINFIDTSYSNFPIRSYKWEFGDGNIDYIQNPSHQYSSIGVYKTCLTIFTDSCASSFCDTITVNGAKTIPVYVFPNPVGSTLTVTFDLAIPDNVDLIIYNYYGKMIKKVSTSAISGMNTIIIPVSDLPSGIYILQISSAKNLISSTKFIKM